MLRSTAPHIADRVAVAQAILDANERRIAAKAGKRR